MDGFVISVEGPSRIDKQAWIIHQILGSYETEEIARKGWDLILAGNHASYKPTCGDTAVLTNLWTGQVHKLPIEGLGPNPN
jgi:hypothetical protein